jgi:hypothetical protein
MLIQCTKKLIDELKLKQVSEVEEDPLFSWHANIITVSRKKMVVFVNDQNRYVIVLYGLKVKDFKNLDQLFIQAVRETFKEECIKDEVIDEYIQRSSQVFYAKTKNRTMVARLNRSTEDMLASCDQLDLNTIIQSAVGVSASSLLVGDGKGSYFDPNEAMYEDLERLSGTSIFGCQAFELNVKLNLEKYHVWRKVIVPSHTTFSKLHGILQICFGWQNYHLHDFYIFDGEKPIVHLVCNEEAFAYPHEELPMILDHERKLTDYLPKYQKMKYTYDFGDDWEHEVELVKVHDEYATNYPQCLAGEGNTPPEDVGGQGGYEYFMEVISDPTHPEHEAIVEWSKMQRHEAFDMEDVNKELKFRSSLL